MESWLRRSLWEKVPRDQSDTRDGTDYNVNASYGLDFGGTRAELSGFYVHTDRTESERSYEYDDPAARTGPVGAPVTDEPPPPPLPMPPSS